MSQENIKLIITEDDHVNYKRLDQLLADKTDMSRNVLKTLFEEGKVTASSKIKLNKVPGVGTEIEIVVPEAVPSEALPENLPIEFLYQDEHIAIINKPSGMVVHPAPGNYSGTLVNALLYHLPDLKGIGGVQRPGIVHRLDKGTSGVMIIAKDQKSHEILVQTFAEHNLVRKYEALTIKKEISHKGIIKTMIDRDKKNRLKMTSRTSEGKEAITNYQIIKQFDNCTHIELTLHTGRTHQIRVHLSETLKCPIINDFTYGNPNQQKQKLSESINALLENYEYPMLHAKLLELEHPITKEKLSYQSEPPKVFKSILEELYGKDNI